MAKKINVTIAKCVICNKTKTIQLRSYKLNIKINGSYSCHKCKSSHIEVTTKISEASKKQMKDPFARKQISDFAKKQWSTGVYNKDRNLTAALATNSDKNKHAKIAKTIKSLWDVGHYSERTININRDAISQTLIEYWKDDKLKKDLSNKIKNAWQDPNKKLNLMSGIAKRDTPQYRKTLSVAMKKVWQRPEFRQKMAQVIANRGSDSVLEDITNNIIKDLGFTPEKHAMHGWTWDCMVRRENKNPVIIDIQGEWFHSKPSVKQRDKIKFSTFTKLDYTIGYLYEIDFYSVYSLRNKICKLLEINQISIQKQFSFDEVKVVEINKTQGNKFLACYHYLNPRRNGIFKGVMLDDTLIAVGVLSPPNYKESATSMGLSSNEVLDISRLCIHPDYHKKNFGSWFISRLIKNVPVKAIISFADTTMDHNGTIYKASGFEQIGKGRKTYWYISNDGRWWHKKTISDQNNRNQTANIIMHGKKLTEAEYASHHGLIRVNGKKIIKYVKWLVSPIKNK